MDKGQVELLQELIFKTHEEIVIIRGCLTDIRSDLAFHIARTNQLEDRTEVIEKELKWLHKQVFLVHGAIGLVSLIALLAGIVKSLS